MLMQSGNWLMLALYILGILLGVGLVAAGYFLTK